MNRTIKSIFMIGAVSFSLVATSAHAEWTDWFSFKRAKEFPTVNDAEYNKECGSCHFAYQPGLMPAASWQKVMDANALADHFGDNAELDNETRQRLLKILVDGAADNTHSKRSRKIMASLDGEAPLRIIEIPYIKSRHSEIPANLVKENPKVKSLSQCQRCHQEIEQGSYDDDSVFIPGHGYWTW